MCNPDQEEKKYCCEELKDGIESSDGNIEKDSHCKYHIKGCCGCCYVVTDIKFCPFCGHELK